MAFRSQAPSSTCACAHGGYGHKPCCAERRRKYVHVFIVALASHRHHYRLEQSKNKTKTTTTDTQTKTTGIQSETSGTQSNITSIQPEITNTTNTQSTTVSTISSSSSSIPLSAVVEGQSHHLDSQGAVEAFAEACWRYGATPGARAEVYARCVRRWGSLRALVEHERAEKVWVSIKEKARAGAGVVLPADSGVGVGVAAGVGSEMRKGNGEKANEDGTAVKDGREKPAEKRNKRKKGNGKVRNTKIGTEKKAKTDAAADTPDRPLSIVPFTYRYIQPRVPWPSYPPNDEQSGSSGLVPATASLFVNGFPVVLPPSADRDQDQELAAGYTELKRRRCGRRKGHVPSGVAAAAAPFSVTSNQ